MNVYIYLSDYFTINTVQSRSSVIDILMLFIILLTYSFSNFVCRLVYFFSVMCLWTRLSIFSSSFRFFFTLTVMHMNDLDAWKLYSEDCISIPFLLYYISFHRKTLFVGLFVRIMCMLLFAFQGELCCMSLIYSYRVWAFGSQIYYVAK